MLASQLADTKRPRRHSKVCFHARTTNRPLDLPAVDARTIWGRRRRDLIRLLIAEIARRGRQVTATQQLLIGQVASLQVRLEQMQGMICRGDADIDDEQISRHGALIARLLDRLGLTSHEPVHQPDTSPNPMEMHRKGDP